MQIHCVYSDIVESVYCIAFKFDIVAYCINITGICSVLLRYRLDYNLFL